ncbi:HAD-IA family hydrolase [Virgibacillus salexigens]|uniref:Phosphoglycolate phosphatase n=1 Tax=Virgibacillus kapii TaxID=1638645 RepID=A0ABQ2DEY1_9BACI|nr:HAD-IA family hydrolase [Virgibacillus kapii]GGJ54978.1 phosphoglycolate phosphatase [Virgibacillus kapii]
MKVLWDFDGTLINTYPSYARQFQQVLPNSVDKQMIYEQLKISFSHTVSYFQMTEAQEREVRNLVDRISPAELLPFEGIEQVLRVADTNVIMTHKDRRNLLRILKQHGLDQYFKDVVTIDDGFPRKPDTASYAYLHDRHNLDLAVGDRAIDLIPAKKLGIQTCSFQNSQVDADYHIDSYLEFFEVVK